MAVEEALSGMGYCSRFCGECLDCLEAVEVVPAWHELREPEIYRPAIRKQAIPYENPVVTYARAKAKAEAMAAQAMRRSA